MDHFSLMESAMHTCCGRVVVDTLGYRTAECGRAAKVERDGKHYCGIHDPVKRAAKQAERDSARQQQFERKRAVRMLRYAAPDMLAALENLLHRYTSLVECGDCGKWDAEQEPEVIAARAAIAKATV